MSSELHELNERWNRAWLAKDAETVERLVADDYVYIAPNGMTLDRQAIMRIIRSPTYRLDYNTRSDVTVRAIGDNAAVVRHRSQSGGAFEGTKFTDDHLGVMICEKQGGAWRIVMEQHSFNSK